MALKRFGVSLDAKVLDALDSFVRDNGFANRSQAIRFLVEKSVTETKWQCNHIVAGTIVLMYDRSKKDIPVHIAEVQDAYRELILSSSQYFLNDGVCLHVTTITGEAHCLTEFSDRLIAIKGIRHGKLLMGRAD
ncbi:MAG: CopG family ribbon-helix-helix protein [Bacteroidales bacterium]|nr:CopG family ribbon-helix-helix protein [Bacteroidales bacterium]